MSNPTIYSQKLGFRRAESMLLRKNNKSGVTLFVEGSSKDQKYDLRIINQLMQGTGISINKIYYFTSNNLKSSNSNFEKLVETPIYICKKSEIEDKNYNYLEPNDIKLDSCSLVNAICTKSNIAKLIDQNKLVNFWTYVRNKAKKIFCLAVLSSLTILTNASNFDFQSPDAEIDVKIAKLKTDLLKNGTSQKVIDQKIAEIDNIPNIEDQFLNNCPSEILLSLITQAINDNEITQDLIEKCKDELLAESDFSTLLDLKHFISYKYYPMLQQFDELCSYEYDWDGDGALPINDVVRRYCYEIIKCCKQHNITEWSIDLNNNGSVYFEGNNRAIINLCDKAFSYFIPINDEDAQTCDYKEFEINSFVKILKRNFND